MTTSDGFLRMLNSPPFYITDVETLNRFLQEAVHRCIYRTNGVCQAKCALRDYCLPETNGLETVEELRGT